MDISHTICPLFGLLTGVPISLDRAQSATHAAVAAARQRNWKMNVAVADSGGDLVAFQRMDGAMLASIQIAEHKARAAVTFRRPTKAFEDGINGGGKFTAPPGFTKEYDRFTKEVSGQGSAPAPKK